VARLSGSFVMLALTSSQILLAQTAQPTTEVPVRTVILFSSGVGYFEHAGTVRGNGSTELRFKTGQINDILKSLVLQDEDGGRVSTITYPSQDPLAKTLRSFQVDITSNPSLADLLNQLRGARVSLLSQAERLSGTILGVEVRRKSVENGDPVESPVLNVLTGATIRAIELQSVSSLTLDDVQLQDELTKALTALTSSSRTLVSRLFTIFEPATTPPRSPSWKRSRMCSSTALRARSKLAPGARWLRSKTKIQVWRALGAAGDAPAGGMEGLPISGRGARAIGTVPVSPTRYAIWSFCGTPFSRISKSAGARSATKRPVLSNTRTSTSITCTPARKTG